MMLNQPLFKYNSNVDLTDVVRLIRSEFELYWFLLFIVLLILVLRVRYFYPNKFNSLFKSTYSLRVVGQLSKEENIYTHPAHVFLNINYYFSIGLTFWIYLTYIEVLSEEHSSYWLIIVGLLLANLYRIIHLRLFRRLFDIDPQSLIYTRSNNLLNQFLGIVFLLSNILIVFGPNETKQILISFNILIFVISYLYQLLRGIYIGFQLKFLPHYLFLYLCALEIAPLFLLIGVIKRFETLSIA